ncbi:MAG: hypothetical protein ACKPCI_23715, partial [Dolichospermum sp.]
LIHLLDKMAEEVSIYTNIAVSDTFINQRLKQQGILTIFELFHVSTIFPNIPFLLNFIFGVNLGRFPYLSYNKTSFQ